MTIIEPHIHMYSRTTDDYTAMYQRGHPRRVEPSFWMGTNRRYAGTFWDYFQLILDFETMRAKRYGIDHYACVSVNPKEAEDLAAGQRGARRHRPVPGPRALPGDRRDRLQPDHAERGADLPAPARDGEGARTCWS